MTSLPSASLNRAVVEVTAAHKSGTSAEDASYPVPKVAAEALLLMSLPPSFSSKVPGSNLQPPPYSEKACRPILSYVNPDYTSQRPLLILALNLARRPTPN